MFIQNRLGMIESVETMRNQEERLNQISNNLANVGTSGYKKDSVTFWEMLYRAGGRDRVGKGVKTATDHAGGGITQTGNPLDLAINGPGFFRIQTPQGIRYSRAGNFSLNEQGQLATANGHLVLGDGGPIVVPSGEATVSEDGGLFADGEQIGRLAVVEFADPSALEKEGLNLFRLKDEEAQELAPAAYRIQQGFLENSNVNVVGETTEMIELHRMYEAQQKAIGIIDELDGQAIRRVGNLTPS